MGDHEFVLSAYTTQDLAEEVLSVNELLEDAGIDYGIIVGNRWTVNRGPGTNACLCRTSSAADSSPAQYQLTHSIPNPTFREVGRRPLPEEPVHHLRNIEPDLSFTTPYRSP